MAAKDIALDNDYEFRIELQRTNATTGELEPATGLAGMTARLSLTDGGAAISGALSVGLTEAAQRPGTYLGRVDGTVLRAEHTAGRLPLGTVWIIAGNGLDVSVSERTTVRATRRPDA